LSTASADACQRALPLKPRTERRENEEENQAITECSSKEITETIEKALEYYFRNMEEQ
jgi:hypothetical protein